MPTGLPAFRIWVDLFGVVSLIQIFLCGLSHSHNITLTLRFLSYGREGVILYARQRETRPGDFFSIALGTGSIKTGLMYRILFSVVFTPSPFQLPRQC